jgi:TolB protein
MNLRSSLRAAFAASCIGIAVSHVAGAAGAGEVQTIALTRVFPAPGAIALVVANADGTDEHPLLGGGELDYDAVWSPTGNDIVFTSERGGSADLYRVGPDGSGLQRLTDHPAYDDQAAFSPDGKQLVFVSTREGGRARLFVLDLATKQVRALTKDTPGDYRPAWSPDGAWIAFSSGRDNATPFSRGRW